MSILERTPGLSPLSSPSKEVSLWMERGYSRNEIAKRMKAAVPDLTLLSSTVQPIDNTEALPFPLAHTPDAIAHLNETIEKYNIDALWPQNSARYDLSDIQTEVHAAATPETIALVDDKVAFNEWLGDDPYRPFSAEVIGVEAIHKEINRLSGEGHELCIKPVIGVGGNGYWRFDKDASKSFLHKPENRTIHPDVYLDALAHDEAVHDPQRMVLMDYLPGPEVSVDLLTWRGTPLIHAARTKEDFSPTQRIQSEHEVIDHTHAIAAKLGFHGIISLQYRLDSEGKWKMIEINPRPAGGSIYSEDGGFGIISNWAKLVSGKIEPQEVEQKHGEVTITQRRVWSQVS